MQKNPTNLLSKSQGGLSLPNLYHYYRAAITDKVIHWLSTPATNWCKFESISCTLSSLAALATSSFPLPIAHFATNPVVINTLRIWFQFRQNFGLQS